MRQVEPMLRHYNVRRITPKDFMRIITVNLNGIRSAAGKGFYEWLAQQDADIVCLQELKAQEADMTGQMLAPLDYHGYFHYAEKKGYSGVGIYCRERPQQVTAGLGIAEFDAEGRYLRAGFAGFRVVALYLPSGSSGEQRQAVKFKFMAAFLPHLRVLRASGREVVVCGDWNIAHKEIDLKNWRLTPGGRIAARHGPRMSAGASITRSPRPASPRGHRRRLFTRRNASPITRR